MVATKCNLCVDIKCIMILFSYFVKGIREADSETRWPLWRERWTEGPFTTTPRTKWAHVPRHIHLKKVRQGKTGSYLKVIKDKVLTDGGIFSSGILCSGVIILMEKTVSLKSFRVIFIRSICKCSYEGINQPCALRILGQSWLEGLCAAAWANSQVASIWSSFDYLAGQSFAVPKIPKVLDKREMVCWDDVF